MFLFKSKKELKAEKLATFSYENTPEFTFKGQEFLSKVLDIYDGDTITITIKIDKLYQRINCRLSGLDTPELKSHDEEEKRAGRMARNHLAFLILGKKIEEDMKREDLRKLLANENVIVNIKCLDFDKYGRLLIELWNNSIFLNQKMIDDGFAGVYDGGTKKPWREFFRH